MTQIKAQRIPVKYKNIQYNFCKNPNCENFGVEPEEESKRGVIGKYSLYGSMPLLKCNACGEMPPLKSNIGIQEEIFRIAKYLESAITPITCPNSICANHNIALGKEKAYRSFGTTKQGAKRFQCCLCKKTFSIAKPTQYQRETHRNIDIFKAIVNKVPLNRIVEMYDVSWNVLYNRIDFIHRQCLAFAANREIELRNMQFDTLHISVDKQDYQVNWTDRSDKRNIVLSAITSCDNDTGYVFGVHPNFDANLDKTKIELDVNIVGDNLINPPYRKYARLWIQSDYDKSVNKKQKKVMASSLNEEIRNQYYLVEDRLDVEQFDDKNQYEMLPSYGMQVHAEYTMIAHFYFLKTLLRNTDYFRFFLDQESGIRSAFMSAFKNKVDLKLAEAFYVSIEKEITVDDKRKLIAESKKIFNQKKKSYPLLSDYEIKIMMIKDEMQRVQTFGKWKDRWINHPLPDMSEANKKMCWLTEHNEINLDDVAMLYNKATLHGVDSFFQKVRRRISLLERPIHSQANRNRVWNGYAPYNPYMVVKLLEIFRVVHNYIDEKKEKGFKPTTPATRIGLSKAPLDYKDILYFQ